MIAATNTLPRFVWRGVFLCFISAGIFGSLYSLFQVQSQAAGSTDALPWGLITGLDVICGLAVSAGAFAITLSGYVINDPTWKVVVRPSMLIGFSGYLVALLGAFGDLAAPSRAWPAVIHLVSSRSMIAGCLWVLAIATLWLWAEFVLTSRVGTENNKTWLHRLLILSATFATILTSAQQWHIASLLVGAGTRLSPLWSSPRLPVLFFTSSLCAGVAVLLFASIRSNSNVPVSGLTKALALLMFLYIALRLNDIVETGALRLTITASGASYFWAEIFLFIASIAWLCDPKPSLRTLYIGTVMALAGILLNRLNTCITALEPSTGPTYHPDWAELSVAYSLVAVGVAMFVVGAKLLNVFPAKASSARARTANAR